MDNQHRQITGYRDLSQAEIDLMNQVKEHAEKTRQLINHVTIVLAEQQKDPLPEGADPASPPPEPMRWIAIARTELQQGYMALNRAIAQPASF